MKRTGHKVAVVGVGTTGWGSFPETDTYGLGMQAFKNALDDSGLQRDDIDGLISSRIPSYLKFGEMAGMNPRYAVHLPSEGRQSGNAVQLAVSAIETGRADYIALVYANNGRSKRVYYGGDIGLWSPWGMTSLGAQHAMMFRQYMDRYNVTNDELAEIPLTFRYHASLNPSAVMRKLISKEDYHSSRYIVEPLHLYDYCLINDGGVCLILTSAERAESLKQQPVYVKGIGQAATLVNSSYTPDDFWYESLKHCADQVYEDSGLSQQDIDGLMIYDNFSPTVLFTLEGFGFCPQGEAAKWVQGGRLKLGGDYPTNTSGGHLSESYMQGWGLQVEAVRQLRGQCNERQIENCNSIQYMAATPIATSIIYGRSEK